jgi:hypothetical protein
MASLVCLALLAGCPGDDDQPQVDGGQCSCPAPTAQKVTYDPASSMLGAENVQDALDELATRPKEAEPPLTGRLTRLTATPDNPGLVNQDFQIKCPAGDIALGGGCGLLLDGKLNNTFLMADGYACAYDQPQGNTNKPTIQVMCFHPVQ